MPSPRRTTWSYPDRGAYYTQTGTGFVPRLSRLEDCLIDNGASITGTVPASRCRPATGLVINNAYCSTHHSRFFTQQLESVARILRKLKKQPYWTFERQSRPGSIRNNDQPHGLLACHGPLEFGVFSGRSPYSTASHTDVQV